MEIQLTNPLSVDLDILQISGAPRVRLDGLELPDDTLIDCLTDHAVVRFALTTTDSALSFSVAHVEDGALVSWSGSSHEFAAGEDEIAMFITVVAGATTTTRTLKVKVRPRTTKPGRVFVLG